MYLQKKLHNKYKKSLNRSSHLLQFGECGFRAQSFTTLTELKIDALVKSLNKLLKHLSKSSYPIKYWNRLQLNSTLTALSPESRMGKGKGAIISKVSYVRPGQVLFEFSNILPTQILILSNYLSAKLPCNIKLIQRKL